MIPRHTLSILVENKPGVLARITGLIARRAYNIHSLAVGVTEVDEISRITFVFDADEGPLEQITKQLNKLVNVLKIVELDPNGAVTRAHILIKVKADGTTRTQVADAAGLFRAHIVDVSPDAVTVEATGELDKLEALLRVLAPFGVREIAQSGIIGLSRGSKPLIDKSMRP